METIKLGDRVRDRITGQKGIVIGITRWLYGCTRVVIQPEEVKDGKPVEPFNIDMPQAELIKPGVVENIVSASAPEKERRHGPRSDPSRGNDASRRV